MRPRTTCQCAEGRSGHGWGHGWGDGDGGACSSQHSTRGANAFCAGRLRSSSWRSAAGRRGREGGGRHIAEGWLRIVAICYGHGQRGWTRASRDGRSWPRAGRSRMPGSMAIVNGIRKAQLRRPRCDPAMEREGLGVPVPVILWADRRAPLPRGHATAPGDGRRMNARR